MSFSGFRGEVKNVSANQRPERPSYFSDRPENTILVEDIEILLPIKFCYISLSGFRGAVDNILANQRPDGHLVFPIGPKNTILVEDIEILLPIKFCYIPFSGFRGAVDNILANKRPGWPSCFSDRPEIDKLGRGCWDLASCQVLLNSVKCLSEEKSKMYQPTSWAAILFFRSARKTQKLVEDIKRSCSLSSFVEFRSAREVENVSLN